MVHASFCCHEIASQQWSKVLQVCIFHKPIRNKLCCMWVQILIWISDGDFCHPATLEIPVSTNTLVNIKNTIPVERTSTTSMFGVFWVNMFREQATSELELVLTNLNLYKKHHVLRTKTSYSSKEDNCLHTVNYHMISQTAVCPCSQLYAYRSQELIITFQELIVIRKLWNHVNGSCSHW